MNHANQFIRLARQMQRAKRKYAYFRELLDDSKPGKYDGYTIYTVREHYVRRHYRAAHVAVRVKSS